MSMGTNLRGPVVRGPVVNGPVVRGRVVRGPVVLEPAQLCTLTPKANATKLPTPFIDCKVRPYVELTSNYKCVQYAHKYFTNHAILSSKICDILAKAVVKYKVC